MSEYDPYQAAMEAEYVERPRAFFGQVSTDAYSVVLVKGVGKVPFDPMQHKPEEKRTAITIAITPLPGSKAQFTLEREMIAESKEWAQIVKPSLRAIGSDLKGINDKWARVVQVPTGRKYNDKNGVEKDATTIKFEALYSSEAEAMAAEAEFFNRTQDESEPEPAPNGGNSAERETAVKFLPALWKASNGDVSVFAQKLASTPPVNRYFTIDSPEAVAVIAAA